MYHAIIGDIEFIESTTTKTAIVQNIFKVILEETQAELITVCETYLRLIGKDYVIPILHDGQITYHHSIDRSKFPSEEYFGHGGFTRH